LNRASGEGGVQPQEYLAKYSADRVRTTAAVWLGSTLGCAECHDHKFDPFTAEDFYSFAAFFADVKEQGIVRSAVHIEKLPVPTKDQSKRIESLDEAIRRAEAEYFGDTPELQVAQREWEERIRTKTQLWTVASPAEVSSSGKATLRVLPDKSVLASGVNPDRDQYTIEGEVQLPLDGEGDRVALRLELLQDDSLPQRGPGRASNGNLVLHGVDVLLDGQPVSWEKAVASHSQTQHSPQYIIDGHPHGWAILPRTGQPLELILTGRLTGERKNDPNRKFEVVLKQNHGNGHNLGRFRLSFASPKSSELEEMEVSSKLRQLVTIESSKRTTAQQRQISLEFRKATPLLSELRSQLAELRREKAAIEKAVVTTLATTATTPRTIRILPRGDWMDQSGPIVQPAVPGFLPQVGPSHDATPNRLDLAQWMVARNNPLVARAFVNRIWMLLFGHGLARNVDDLGSQGEPPTHPQLLDWLAVEFIESGWDVKHLVRVIVLSRAYRQSSRGAADLIARDPYNRLYARQSRWRLDAEMIRDNALAVSGLLNTKLGGVSVKPYQPDGYWGQLNFPKRRYQHNTGEAQYRRGLYTHWQRTFLHPSLLAFDAPPREECTAQRSRSNTPLQSLVLLNDPTFVESASALARQVVGLDKNDFDARLAWLTRCVLHRQPREQETRLLHSLHSANLARFRQRPGDAKLLVETGQRRGVPADDFPQLAAWTTVARALLNLHETMTRY
jgi:hypothetical protein